MQPNSMLAACESCFPGSAGMTACSVCATCPTDQYASGCSGSQPGTCVPCSTTRCSYGEYLSGCGGVWAGSCATCRSCATGCGGSYAGLCAGDVSNGSGSNAGTTSTSKSDSTKYLKYLGFIPLLLFCGCFMRARIIARRNQQANALREEKLQQQGLACMRFVNHTGVAVQARA